MDKRTGDREKEANHSQGSTFTRSLQLGLQPGTLPPPIQAKRGLSQVPGLFSKGGGRGPLG